MSGKPIEIPVKVGGITEMRKQIRVLQGEIIAATDPKEVQRLSQELGGLQDAFADANESAAVFASGSKYEQTSNALGQIQSALLNLDFDKAQARAKSMATVASSITFGDAVTSLRDLGKTFVTLGKALLTNPIFIIGAVIAAVVVGIYKLLDSLGVIKKAFDIVGDAVQWVIDLLKSFMDWLGLSDFEGEKRIENQQKRNDELIASYRKVEAEVTEMYDHEIAKANAAGVGVAEAEAAKRAAIMETLVAQNNVLRAHINSGLASQEQIKIWNENQAKIKAINREVEINAIKTQRSISEEADKAAKEAEQRAKEAAQKAKEFAANRLTTARQLEDMRLAGIEDAAERETAINEVKYRRLIEDTKKNETLLASEKRALITAFELERDLLLDQSAEQRNRAELERVMARQQILDDISIQNIHNQYDREEAARMAEYDKRIAELKSQGILTAEVEKALAAQLVTELGIINTEREKSEEEKRKEGLEREQAVTQAKIDLASGALSAASAFAKEGSEISKAFAVGQVVMDTYKGIQATFASAAANPASIAFPAFPFIQAGIAATFGIANIKKILSTNPGSAGGASVPRGGSPGGGGATPATPQFNLMGSGNDLNNRQQSSSVERREPMAVRAYVTETDITSSQRRVSRMNQLSEL